MLTLDTVTVLLDSLVPPVMMVRKTTSLFLVPLHTIPHLLSDIRECEANNGGCDQICTDFPGGYSCSCRSGFETDGPSCIGMVKVAYLATVSSTLDRENPDLSFIIQRLMSVQETMTAVRSVSTLLDHTTATVRVASSWSMALSVKVHTLTLTKCGINIYTWVCRCG